MPEEPTWKETHPTRWTYAGAQATQVPRERLLSQGLSTPLFQAVGQVSGGDTDLDKYEAKWVSNVLDLHCRFVDMETEMRRKEEEAKHFHMRLVLRHWSNLVRRRGKWNRFA